MKSRRWGLASAAMLLATVGAQHPPEPARFPSSLSALDEVSKKVIPGFPDPAGVQALRESGTPDAIRSHAWKLFAGLVLNSTGKPLWDSWPTEADVEATAPNCAAPAQLMRDSVLTETSALRLAQNLKTPEQFGIGSPRSQGQQPQFAEILFNPSAASQISKMIRGTRSCSLADALSRLAGNDHKGSLNIPDLPPDAIAVKTIWELIPGPGHGSPLVKQISVWDPVRIKPLPGASDEYPPVSQWNTAIAIDTSQDSCDPSHDYSGGEVPLACFYYQDISPEEEQVIMHQAFVVHNPTNEGVVPYRLILLGFHVITREIRQWTWQTYYWSNAAFGADAVRQKGNPWTTGRDPRWSHYVMDTTLGGPGNRSPKTLPPVFNPYLEGVQLHGATSNCINCHQYAVYHMKPPAPPSPTGYSLAQRTPHNAPTSAEVSQYMENGLATSFLWTFADINQPMTSAPGIPDTFIDFFNSIQKIGTPRP
jgi:hypothetical protein